MFHALYTAASGMTAQQINLDNIANNLANASTTGFQSRRVQFSDLLYQSEIMPGSAATQQTTVAAGLQVGLGTRPGNTEIIQTQGDLSSTGNPLDFAIEGSGFFQVLMPNNQIGYTRAGSFQPNRRESLLLQTATNSSRRLPSPPMQPTSRWAATAPSASPCLARPTPPP